MGPVFDSRLMHLVLQFDLIFLFFFFLFIVFANYVYLLGLFTILPSSSEASILIYNKIWLTMIGNKGATM
jgi:hypothetical protein